MTEADTSRYIFPALIHNGNQIRLLPSPFTVCISLAIFVKFDVSRSVPPYLKTIRCTAADSGPWQKEQLLHLSLQSPGVHMALEDGVVWQLNWDPAHEKSSASFLQDYATLF